MSITDPTTVLNFFAHQFILDISGVSNGKDLWDPEEEVEDNEDYEDYYEPDYNEADHEWGVPSKVVQNALYYSAEDIKALRTYVMVCPCESTQGGRIVPKKASGELAPRQEVL